MTGTSENRTSHLTICEACVLRTIWSRSSKHIPSPPISVDVSTAMDFAKLFFIPRFMTSARENDVLLRLQISTAKQFTLAFLTRTIYSSTTVLLVGQAEKCIWSKRFLGLREIQEGSSKNSRGSFLRFCRSIFSNLSSFLVECFSSLWLKTVTIMRAQGSEPAMLFTWKIVQHISRTFPVFW